MSRWFRFYDDVVNDPKAQNLSDNLFRSWVNILCIASKNDGKLPQIKDVAFLLRCSVPKANKILKDLIDQGLIDEIDGNFVPHNWNARQFKSDVSNERVKQHRERQRNAECNVTVTPPDTDTDTDTDQNRKKEREVALVDDGWPADYREQFWLLYPNKVGKPKALAKLEQARKRGVLWQQIISGLERYIRDKPPDRAWLNPETFINQERWADQPAAAVLNRGRGPPPKSFADIAFDLHERMNGKPDDSPSIQDFEQSGFDLDLAANRPC